MIPPEPRLPPARAWVLAVMIVVVMAAFQSLEVSAWP